MRRAVAETKRVVSVILCRSVIAKLEEDGYAYTFLLDKHCMVACVRVAGFLFSSSFSFAALRPYDNTIGLTRVSTGTESQLRRMLSRLLWGPIYI